MIARNVDSSDGAWEEYPSDDENGSQDSRWETADTAELPKMGLVISDRLCNKTVGCSLV